VEGFGGVLLSAGGAEVVLLFQNARLEGDQLVL
jgi:hypothetical protein